MHCGELAEACGVSPDTVRHYDRLGLLHGSVRSANGYRNFPAQTVQRIGTIRAALAVGFTLEELARIFKERDAGGCPCTKVRQMAHQKLDELEIKLLELNALRGTLKQTLKQWDVALNTAGQGKRAHLLESLNGKHRHASKKKLESFRKG